MTSALPTFGPLILGATGRVGTMWRTLAANGLWPDDSSPLWHARTPTAGRADTYAWDMTGEAPHDARLSSVSGMIVLAGATSGDAEALSRNTSVALAALDLAAREGIAPVLLCSSVATYGPPAADAAPLGEDAPLAAAAPYGMAKRDMERAAAAHPHPATCLRIANIAGADALFGAAAAGPVTLDRFPDGVSPMRHMIGPRTLADIACRLIERHEAGTTLPRALNMASPGVFEMADMLRAMSVPFDWRPAGENALRGLPLDLRLLETLVPLAETTPHALVAEARAAGWVPHVVRVS